MRFYSSGGTILGMVLHETAVIVVAGIAVGLPTACIASSLPQDAVVRAVAARSVEHWAVPFVATLLVTMIAGYIPARRASRVDPMVTLRCK